MANYIDRQAGVDMFQRMAYDDWNQLVLRKYRKAVRWLNIMLVVVYLEYMQEH